MLAADPGDARGRRVALGDGMGRVEILDAEELIAHHCLRAELAKTRYFVPHGQLTWQVDIYKGILAGVILAEVELPSEVAELALPVWVGREVTGNPDYKKINMVNARVGTASRVA